MTEKMENLSLSVGRDYNTYNRYEYVVFKDEEIVARAGGFVSSAAARHAGIKAAQNIINKGQ